MIRHGPTGLASLMCQLREHSPGVSGLAQQDLGPTEGGGRREHLGQRKQLQPEPWEPGLSRGDGG